MDRRNFLRNAGVALAAATITANPLASLAQKLGGKKMRLAMVGTGHRGSGMWGKSVQHDYADVVEFVGLCDINPGRMAYVAAEIGVGKDCKLYTDFDKMLSETKPDALIVTTVDATHDEFIVKGLNAGCNIITEKPMTTDELKCQAILDAERKSGKKVIVTFNYRYSPHRQKLYELLREGRVGDITSVDFHWYLNTRHGADYFRRWHRLREKSGSLLLHKASHHFDLLGWWINSEPESVYALGALDFYGKNGTMRGECCRKCDHQKDCNFFMDITKNDYLFNLYCKNEHHDGYLRDGCVFKEDINIFDKMAATIRYANGVQVAYSLTAYSPYEGYRIAFNGTKGRLEAWVKEDKAVLGKEEGFDELTLYTNFAGTETFRIPQSEGHGGGDVRLKDKIFRYPNADDKYRQAASSRDGAMAILTGVAARKSIDTGATIRIADLTDLKPRAVRAEV
ncbi:MAG: Gfo/Idh/MocA family oxidoreductase [Prevotellaceae bacterium]|jgi:predicted dehydrogenase|nr:Gfo/Idh/MocA family oxidoreductase [Prevotellaceae bacterium]